MQWVSLNRAVRLGATPRGWWPLQVTGIVSALIIPLMLVLLGMIAELMASRGHLELPASHAARIADWAGDPDRQEDGNAKYDDKGLLPVVYRYRDTPLLGTLLVGRYESSAWMRSNGRCLWVLLILGGLLATLESVLLWFFYFNAQRAAFDVGIRLRGAVHDQAFRLGVSDLLGDPVTQAEKLITEQVPLVERALNRRWRTVPRSFVVLVTSLLLALLSNVWLALVTLLIGVFIWLLYSFLKKRTETHLRQYDEHAASELIRLCLQLRRVPLAAGFQLARVPGEPREDVLRRFRQHVEQGSTHRAMVGPALFFCVMMGAGLVLLLVGVNIFRVPPGMTVGTTVLLGASLVVAFFPARRLQRLWETAPKAEQAAAAVFAYLDREPSVVEVPGSGPLGRLSDKVQLDCVTLADRHGRKLLNNVSLTIPARAETAIVASDASVPIALAGLLARFYDPAAGRVLYDGHDVRTVTLRTLRQQATVVAGNGQLFDGTVSENISCGEERYTQLQIIDAAKLARAYNFVKELPQGFATVLGPKAHRLDAGQAYRIALARVALRDPSLIVLQEPREPLDQDSAAHIDDALRRLGQGRTVVLLPTRLETLRSADRVILLHEGKVVAESTHQEMLKSNELYRHLIYVRFNPYGGTVSPG
jgi:ABC-type multidrug transport system fused ATPase/permease subunit